MIPDLRASGSRRTARIISASSGCWTTLSAVQLLLHPLADERSLFDSARRRNATKRQALLSTERHANCVTQLPSEHGLADFLQLVVEVRNAMGVPELSQLLDRIGVRNPHAFFPFAYRRSITGRLEALSRGFPAILRLRRIGPSRHRESASPGRVVLRSLTPPLEPAQAPPGPFETPTPAAGVDPDQ